MNNRIWYLVMILIVGAFTFAVVNDATHRGPELLDDVGYNPASSPPTAEGQAILEAIKVAGYPSADKMSKELKARIVTALENRELKVIDYDPVGMFTAWLVGFTTSDQCADQDVCLVVITNEKGTFVSYVGQVNYSDIEETCSPSLGGFFGGDKYLIIKQCQQNIGGYEAGYAVTIQSGVASPIATIHPMVPEPIWPKDPTDSEAEVVGGASFVYQEHTFVAFISEKSIPSSPRAGPITVVHFVDENGKLLKGFETLYSAPNPIGDKSIAIDYQRTATYGTSATADENDPLKSLLPFSGKGLYMWIQGGLYYFDPATGTIGLDLKQSP